MARKQKKAGVVLVKFKDDRDAGKYGRIGSKVGAVFATYSEIVSVFGKPIKGNPKYPLGWLFSIDGRLISLYYAVEEHPWKPTQALIWDVGCWTVDGTTDLVEALLATGRSRPLHENRLHEVEAALEEVNRINELHAELAIRKQSRGY